MIFLEICRFEVQQAFRNTSTHVYAIILFAGGFLLMNLMGGAFEGMNISFSSDQIKVNSPFLIDKYLSIFSLLGVFITAGIVGSVVIKDYRYQFFPFIFTSPVGKSAYLTGKFLAAFIINAFIFLAPVAGLLIGSQMPYLQQGLFGDTIIWYYLSPYLSLVIPNIFFVGALFFSLSQLFRNMAVNWFAIIIFYVLYFAGFSLVANDIDYRQIGALIDPFGLASSVFITTGTSAHEANTEVVSLEGLYLMNRLLWMGVGFLALFLMYLRFKFSHLQNSWNLFGKKSTPDSSQQPYRQKFTFGQRPLSNIEQRFTGVGYIKQYFQLIKLETAGLFKNSYFLLIIITALVFLYFSSNLIGKIYDTSTYPVTAQVVSLFSNTMHLFIFITIALFAGELIHRERSVKMHELFFAMPVPRGAMITGKFIAILTATIIMLSLIIVIGVLVQYRENYYNKEFWLYLKLVFGKELIKYIPLIVLAFFIHTVVNNKYIGYFLMGLFYIWDSYFAQFVLQHNLLIYGGASNLIYSDMNGFGYNFYPYIMIKIYWLSVGVGLMILVHHIGVTHVETDWKSRLRVFKERLTHKTITAYGGAMLLILTTGGFVFYNTNILNDFNRSFTLEQNRVKYEKTYKKYKSMAQPKIVAVDMKADIYPKRGSLNVKSVFWLKNKTTEPIDTLHLNYSREELIQIEFSQEAEHILRDDELDVHQFYFEQALMPGDSVRMQFTIAEAAEGFTNSGYTTSVQPNGTFFNQSILPVVGYQTGRELSRARLREKHGLPAKPPVPPRTDPDVRHRNAISHDADFIRFKATISTSSDQTVLAPGKLTETWKENGRNYFRYELDRPVLKFFAVLSAHYEVEKARWIPEDTTQNPVNIAVYYHSGHSYNISRMIAGAQKSLHYYTTAFGPYPFEQIRIVEFPRIATFAQAYPTLIPFSESIGFIADLRELDKENVPFEDLKIDYPFYVTAHEMAHQWWPHQIVPAHAEGGNMIIETLAQYSALKVMENTYGRDNMKKFLRHELFKYLTRRFNGHVNERPLATVTPGQQYVFYNKGAVVMYELDDYLGEETVVQVLQQFIKKYRYQGPPYPTTMELIENLKQATPDSLQYIIHDRLEKIALYKFIAFPSTYKRTPEFEYIVKSTIKANKFYYDNKGKEFVAEMNDYVEIGIYNSDDELIYLEKVKLRTGSNNLELRAPAKPDRLVIDPHYKMMIKDKIIKNRSIDIEPEF